MRRLLVLVLVVVSSAATAAQFRNPIKKLPGLDRMPGLDRILDHPPLSTTGEDAWLEAPTLDAIDDLEDNEHYRDGVDAALISAARDLGAFSLVPRGPGLRQL